MEQIEAREGTRFLIHNWPVFVVQAQEGRVVLRTVSVWHESEEGLNPAGLEKVDHLREAPR
jgi:hypothetical protein